MKKKMALAAVIILLLSVAGYGTYAYLTASTTAKNVITAGTVKIELTEVSDELEVSKSLGSDEPYAYVMPNTEKPGHVVVKNIGGNDCYVRVKLVPAISSATETSLKTDKIGLVLNTDDWVKDDDNYWRYTKKLASGESTSNLLTSVLFDKSMGNEYQNSVIHISISAQAVQAAHNDYNPETGSVNDIQGWPATPTPVSSATP